DRDVAPVAALALRGRVGALAVLRERGATRARGGRALRALAPSRPPRWVAGLGIAAPSARDGAARPVSRSVLSGGALRDPPSAARQRGRPRGHRQSLGARRADSPIR